MGCLAPSIQRVVAVEQVAGDFWLGENEKEG